ncbi:uncharacterized protein MELLADRAFT_123710 [Melampsora larici-populina 98AG31]|uniref:Secreted protein n=1 Tax=Melampsora larici-populina (strain 98AG31 / pathotype 3-4-7) TaxID=747676 RepID=F4RQ55_MELLP|nr:uncharacterized protein MELLADRAFT_123710 [Melampsora larici-populina 98AG31]EGG05469.1 secreted protein [Melampsora larici-populina 98AG31]
MLAICRLFLIVTLLASHGLSLPVVEGDVQESSSPSTLSTHSIVRRKEKKSGSADYASFQISDGTAGKAKENAIKVFLTPYKLTLSDSLVIGPDDNLKKISKSDYQKIKSMASVASKSEEGFNKAIKGGKDAALQRGKIANKVLKIMGHLTYIYIDKANGKGAADLEKETKKLKKNIATDKADNGKSMKSFLSKK